MYLYTLLTIIATLSVSIEAAPTGTPPPMPKASATLAGTLANVGGTYNNANLNSYNNLSASQTQNAGSNVYANQLLNNNLVSASGSSTAGTTSSANKNKLTAAVNVGASGGNTAKTSTPTIPTTSSSTNAVKISGNNDYVGSTASNTANLSTNQSKSSTVGVDSLGFGNVIVASNGGSANKNGAANTVNVGESGSNAISTASGSKGSSAALGNAGFAAIKETGDNNYLNSNTNNNSNVAKSQALYNTVGLGTVQSATTIAADGASANLNKATGTFNVGSSVSNSMTGAKHR